MSNEPHEFMLPSSGQWCSCSTNLRSGVQCWCSFHSNSLSPLYVCVGQILMSGQRGAVPQSGMPQVSSVMEDEILMDLI